MPCVKRLNKLGIYIHYEDHPPPHFHVRLAGSEVKIRIGDLGVIEGQLAPRPLRRVRRWAEHHQKALTTRWEQASRHERLSPIQD